MAGTISPPHINVEGAVEMRHLTLEDGGAFYGLVDDNRNFFGRWFEWAKDLTPQKALQRVERDNDRAEADLAIVYGIHKGSRLVGVTGIWLNEFGSGVMECMVDRQHNGQNIGFNAVRTLAQIATVGLGVGEIRLSIDERNRRSANFAERLGAEEVRDIAGRYSSHVIKGQSARVYVS